MPVFLVSGPLPGVQFAIIICPLCLFVEFSYVCIAGVFCSFVYQRRSCSFCMFAEFSVFVRDLCCNWLCALCFVRRVCFKQVVDISVPEDRCPLVTSVHLEGSADTGGDGVDTEHVVSKTARTRDRGVCTWKCIHAYVRVWSWYVDYVFPEFISLWRWRIWIVEKNSFDFSTMDGNALASRGVVLWGDTRDLCRVFDPVTCLCLLLRAMRWFYVRFRSSFTTALAAHGAITWSQRLCNAH